MNTAKVRETKRRGEYIPYSFTGLPSPIMDVMVVEAIAEIDGEEIGSIRYVFNKRHRIAEIETILVRKTKLGVGRRLVEYAEEDMKANRITRVVLSSDFEQLGDAEGFWISLGYTLQHGFPTQWKFMEKKLR